METLMHDVGCQPPHWKSNSNLSICSSANQIKNFSDQPGTNEIEFATPPCKVIDRLDYSYEEREVNSNR